MATFELILLLGIAVLISSIVDQFVPKVSLPLIQIGLGVVIAFLAISPVTINIEPELFLILFIAPLLFSDALEANKKNLWENKGTILSFAIGLVIVITLCVGFAVNALIPSIPLAAAFALGAALGPNDAVAVKRSSKRRNLRDEKVQFCKERHLLMMLRALFHFSLQSQLLSQGSFLFSMPPHRYSSVLSAALCWVSFWLLYSSLFPLKFAI